MYSDRTSYLVFQEGLPKVAYGSAEAFYDRLERDSRDLASWKGELVRNWRDYISWTWP